MQNAMSRLGRNLLHFSVSCVIKESQMSFKEENFTKKKNLRNIKKLQFIKENDFSFFSLSIQFNIINYLSLKAREINK